MEQRLFPRKILPGCRADVLVARRLRRPVPVASNRPIRNLSQAGISLLGLRSLPRGTVVKLMIMGPGAFPSFQVQGIVRWVDERRNEMGMRLTLTGIEFCPVDDEIRGYLDRLLEWKRHNIREDRRLASIGSGRYSAF